MSIPRTLKSLLFILLVCNSTFVFAADFEVRDTELHLVDTLDDVSNYATLGFIESMPADEGTKFLCLSFELVGKNWEEKEKPMRLDGKLITLQVGDETIKSIGTHQMKGKYSTFLSSVYLSRPFSSKTTESSYRVRPIFMVPADFKTAKINLGDVASAEVLAADAKPMTNPSEYVGFSVLKTQFVDDLAGTKYLLGKNKTYNAKAMNGKFLKVTIEITPKKSNSTRDGAYTMSSNDLCIMVKDTVIPCAGQKFSSTKNFATSMSTTLNLERTAIRDYYFVVKENTDSAKLFYLTEDVGSFKVEK